MSLNRSLFLSLLFFGSTLPVVAVTNAELEALEQLIQQQEVEQREAERVAAEARLKAETAAKEQAERQRQQAVKQTIQARTSQRQPEFSWETYRQLQGKWGVPIESRESTQLIFYNTDITFESDKLVFTSVSGNITHTFNILPEGEPHLVYNKPCGYAEEKVQAFKSHCPDSRIIPRNCEVSAKVSDSNETITVYIKTPELSSTQCSPDEWITYRAIYERVP